MAFETGSKTQLVRIVEVTWGTTPATPAMTKTRFTSVSLEPVMGMIESKELRSDRMTADVRGTTLNGEGTIAFEFAPTDFDDLIEAALGGTWTANVLKAGATQKSFSMEVGHTGISQYKLLKGCLVDKFSLDIKPNAIVTGSFSLISKDFAVAGTSAATTTPAASGLSPYDAQNSATVIKEGGTTIAYITGLSFTLDNGIEKATVVGSKSLAGAQFGRSKITGTVTALFQDATLLAKFLAETATSIECTLSNGTKSHALKFGNVKYTGGKSSVSTEGLLAVELPFTALYDGTSTSNLQITRVP
jgi:Phage tail tube protein